MPVRAVLLVLCLTCAAAAWTAPEPPGPATVHVVRSDTILVPQGIFAPRILYPEGRVDFDVIERMVDDLMRSVTGQGPNESWRQLFSPSDTIGIMIGTGAYPVQVATVEVLVDRLVKSGFAPQRIIVFGGDERELFSAGFSISRDPGGVRVLGTESEGYRGGISRIVSEYCDAIINVASLQADPQLGMAGCVANTLVAVPNVKRVAILQQPETLPAIAAHAAVRRKIKLNLLEAYLPLLEMADQTRTTWQYKGLLGGTDMVAVDTVGWRILQAGAKACKADGGPLAPEPQYLRTAQETYQLGQAQEDRISVELSGSEQDSYLK